MEQPTERPEPTGGCRGCDAGVVTAKVVTAQSEWLGRLAAIAADGGSPDANSDHLEFVARHGELLAAVDEGEVVGFGGAVEAHGARMVSDLFVAAPHRGRGVGGALLAALLDGAVEAFTFSSAQPAALAAYRRAGLAAGWPLLTMRGVARGGGDALASGEWVGDRPEIARHVVAGGGWCTGTALIGRTPAGLSVHRLVSAAAANAVLDGLMAGIAVGSEIQLSVPASSPALEWLVLHDFRIVDVDIFCGTAGVSLPADLWVVHRGLC